MRVALSLSRSLSFSAPSPPAPGPPLALVSAHLPPSGITGRLILVMQDLAVCTSCVYTCAFQLPEARLVCDLRVGVEGAPFISLQGVDGDLS